MQHVRSFATAASQFPPIPTHRYGSEITTPFKQMAHSAGCASWAEVESLLDRGNPVVVTAPACQNDPDDAVVRMLQHVFSLSDIDVLDVLTGANHAVYLRIGRRTDAAKVAA